MPTRNSTKGPPDDHKTTVDKHPPCQANSTQTPGPSDTWPHGALVYAVETRPTQPHGYKRPTGYMWSNQHQHNLTVTNDPQNQGIGICGRTKTNTTSNWYKWSQRTIHRYMQPNKKDQPNQGIDICGRTMTNKTKRNKGLTCRIGRKQRTVTQ
jgi:hypothetical protein